MTDNIVYLMEEFESAKTYWLNKLSEEFNDSRLPKDFYNTNKSERNIYHAKFSGELAREIYKFSKYNDLSLYVSLLTIFKIMIFKFSETGDTVVASPVLNMMEQEFNNYIILRDCLNPENTFKEALMFVKQTVNDGYKNQYYPVRKLVDELTLDNVGILFRTILVLESIQDKEKIREMVDSSDNYLTFCFASNKDDLECNISYNSVLFKHETVVKLFECYMTIASQVLGDKEIKLKNIELVTQEEKVKLLYEFNDTSVNYPNDKTIGDLFLEQAYMNPDSVAVTCTLAQVGLGDNSKIKYEKLTYKELNIKSTRLAGTLRQKGVGRGSIVALMLGRRIEVAPAILGILKSGGAYMPIDPDYPLERIQYMIKDSGAKILLTQSDLLSQDIRDLQIQVETIDDDKLYDFDETELESINTSDDLAYVIYTSGSTGKPKGVMIEHRSLVNFIEWRIKKYGFSKDDVTLQLLSSSFDGYGTNFYSSILSGGNLLIIGDDKWRDFNCVKSTIWEMKVTNMSLVPSLYSSILDSVSGYEMKSVRFVVVAGDKIPPELIKKTELINPMIKIINEYGPTENTITTSAHIGSSWENPSVIGRPIGNNKVYILNHSNNPVPLGISGELCISGDGLARGYLNRPELSMEKFIENPFIPGERIYKTGDMARWLPDGNLEFIDRMDNQVKIRGYRIELGEIESQLRNLDQLNESVVVDRMDAKGNKYLCAYYTAYYEMSPTELREYLLKKLPEYMVPTYFVCLEKIPLSLNGKVAKELLPSPIELLDTRTIQETPENETEEIMVRVWQEVFGLESVGINDSFITLGGDSIKAIQIAINLQKYDFKLDVKDIFKYPTIKELCKCVETGWARKQTLPVEGEVELTPVQRWFFQQGYNNKSHFNQAVMLYRKDGFDGGVVKNVFEAVVKHHDALRMVYILKGDNVSQYNRNLDGDLLTYEVFNLEDEVNYKAAIEKESVKLNSAMDIEHGPLVRLGIFKTCAGCYLLIVIHHLVVDGVSWRIILEDFALGYTQALNNEPISLVDKTDSYKEWGARLKAYADSDELLTQLDYWNNIENTNIDPLHRDGIVSENVFKDHRTVEISFTEDYTQKLLKEVPKAYFTEINDILLIALGLAVRKWANQDRVVINLEGHGREEIFKDVDIKRTVGWFTTNYPVVLEIKDCEELSYQIKSIKESLRKIENKGIGYGILKYVTSHERKGKNLVFNLQPEINFNYLGQFDQDIDTGVFNVSDLSTGISVSPDTKRLYALDINGMILSGRLSISFGYNRCEYYEETIKKLAGNYMESLLELIDHCVNKENSERTLSDIADKELSKEDFDEISCIIENL